MSLYVVAIIYKFVATSNQNRRYQAHAVKLIAKTLQSVFFFNST